MKATVVRSYVTEKFALLNFKIEDKYLGSAVAFPSKYVEDKPVTIPYSEFQSLLEKDKEIYVRWSKSLSRYVVRF